MEYLIVGGSIAGATAAKAIRANDPDGSITMITAEKPFYYRPMIPSLIDGSMAEGDIAFPKELAEGLGVQVVHDQAATLDAENKIITAVSENRFHFDKLLIATGSVPLIPGVPGIERALPLRTLHDADKIKTAATAAKKAVILGGGLVGIKAAVALTQLGIAATIIEKLDQILFPRLDPKGAGMVLAKLEEAGIKVILTDTIFEVLSAGVRLASGEEIEADLVVVAIGTRPNTDWLNGSGLRIDQAVVVDEKMQTSASQGLRTSN